MDMASQDKTILSIIVPVKDEQRAIAPFVERVSAVIEALPDPAAGAYEILFVDDGSRDATLAEIISANRVNPCVRALSLSRNFGKEAALSAGLDHARGMAVVPMDVDLQDPPEVLGEMVAQWRAGAEMVNGVRRQRDSDSAGKRFSAAFYYKIHNALSADKIPPHAGDFRLLDRCVVETIRLLPERNRFMKGIFAWSGFKQATVEYDRVSRKVGQSKFSGWKLWTLALDGITASSTVPLRIWTYIGGSVALAAFGYAGIIMLRTLLWGIDVPGYASLLVAILFLGGLQLLSLGILGEYVGRILTETKGRPVYVVREKVAIVEGDPAPVGGTIRSRTARWH